MTIQNILDMLDDDDFAVNTALNCHDPQHDNRWCPTCSCREDGINEYRDRLIKKIKKGMKS
jgi:hypothetical protein